MIIADRRSGRWAEWIVYEIKPKKVVIAGEPVYDENGPKSRFRLTMRRRYGARRAAGGGMYKSLDKARARGVAFMRKEEQQKAFDRQRDKVYFRPKRRRRK